MFASTKPAMPSTARQTNGDNFPKLFTLMAAHHVRYKIWFYDDFLIHLVYHRRIKTWRIETKCKKKDIGNKQILNFRTLFIRILVLTINIDYDNVLPQYNSNVIHSNAWDYWKIFQKVNDGEIYSSFKILFILIKEYRNLLGNS